MDYKEYQKSVYNFLVSRRTIKKNFNFSVRQKASKGAETNYFIGTERSGYFGFTFWDIPVSYPGSSSDLINFIFWLDKGLFRFKFQFVTTKAAHGLQNEADLFFGKELFKALKDAGDIDVQGRPDKHKMLYFEIKPLAYTTFNDLVGAFENMFDTLSSIIDQTILEVKDTYPEWDAGRYTNVKFDNMQRKMHDRINKFALNLNEGSEEDEPLITEVVDDRNEPESKHPLNTILYGPPGTGKTYATIEKATSIIDPTYCKDHSREAIKREYDRLVSKERIVFTTFHQSLSYEDFVEGIKPKTLNSQVVYEIEDGIFKNICNAAYEVDGNFDEVLARFKNDISEPDGKEPKLIEAPSTHFSVIYRGTNVFYVQPKNTIKDKPWYPVNISNIRKAFESNVYKGIYNTTYVREIINYLAREYDLKKGGNNTGNKNEPYVLIIDEINRGNIAQVFGELITLIEDGKRKGQSECLDVTLPYSKETFFVPNNLYIIGTMNTADRSVETLDIALRRRFSFQEMQPQPELLTPQRMMWQFWWEEWEWEWDDEEYIIRENKMIQFLGIPESKNEIGYKKSIWEPMLHDGLQESQIKNFDDWEFSGVNLEHMLSTINSRLIILLDKDHTIGHAWFMRVRSLNDLKRVFADSIIPLLQEFFYNDYGKIGLVLGDAFIVRSLHSNPENFFANFNGVDKDTKKELLSTPVYKIRMPEDDELMAAFKSIYASPVIPVPLQHEQAN